MTVENFQGFEPANTTPVPDILFDELLEKLSGPELKCILYIIRRTLGFKKQIDSISLTQFHKGITTSDGRVLDHGCGLSSRSLIARTLASLEQQGYIIATRGKDESREHIITRYQIHFRGSTSQALGSTSQALGVVPTGYQGSTYEALGVVPVVHPQETVIQETVIQETVIQDSPSSKDDAKPAKKTKKKSSSPALTSEQTALYETFERLSDTKQIRSKANTAAIDELLSVEATPQTIQAVYQEIMKDSWWHGRLTIPAFSRQYPTKLSLVKIKQNGNGAHNGTMSKEQKFEHDWRQWNAFCKKRGEPEITMQEFQQLLASPKKGAKSGSS